MKNKGITLIALVITIIVLIILAGVSIDLLLGDNGLINKSKETVKVTEIAKIKEEAEFVRLGLDMDYLSNRKNAEKLKKATLLSKLNDYFEGSTKNGNRVTTSDEKYDIIVRNNLEILVIEHNKSYLKDGEIELDYYYDETETERSVWIEIYPEVGGIPTYEEYAIAVLEGKGEEEIAPIFVEGNNYWNVQENWGEPIYNNINELISYWSENYDNGPFTTIEEMCIAYGYENLYEFAIDWGYAEPEGYYGKSYGKYAQEILDSITETGEARDAILEQYFIESEKYWGNTSEDGMEVTDFVEYMQNDYGGFGFAEGEEPTTLEELRIWINTNEEDTYETVEEMLISWQEIEPEEYYKYLDELDNSRNIKIECSDGTIQYAYVGDYAAFNITKNGTYTFTATGPNGETGEVTVIVENIIFSTKYGVIEVKFMKDNTYNVSETANAPKVDEANGMKLVKFDTATSEWVEGTEYSYVAGTGTADNTESKWANAKVTVDGIDSYFVWIPRYAYKITYFDTPAHRDAYRLDKTQTEGIVGYSDSRGMVDVSGKTFETVASTTSIDVGDYYMVHPAFTADASVGGGFGELEGLWVGKYEASKSNATATSGGTGTTLKVVSSVKSRNITDSLSIGEMYTAARDYNTNLNSHMIKNSEWGAVAYLTDSQYGRNGNEIAVNQCMDCITGAGPGEGDSNIYNSTYAYDATNFATKYSYTSIQGKKASTTGNVYGVYDMSGGAYEYVASYYNASTYKDSNNKTYYELYASSFASSGGTSNEYSTVYTGTTAKSNYIKGDAIYETRGWYYDILSRFVDSNSPFVMRSSDFDDTIGITKLFKYGAQNGGSFSNVAFRLCLSVK